MAKVYEYKGKKYCEIDFSEKDDTYGGGWDAETAKALPPVTPTEQTIKEIMDFIGGMNMVGEISNEAYAKISEFVDDGTPTERTGEWIEHDPKTKGLAKIYECPFCGDEVIGEKTNFCPNCRAKMKGGTENE